MAGRVRVAGSGVLYDGERVLLARRHPASRFFGDFFAFVGGALEAGESPVEATRREIKEELGMPQSDQLPRGMRPISQPAKKKVR